METQLPTPVEPSLVINVLRQRISDLDYERAIVIAQNQTLIAKEFEKDERIHELEAELKLIKLPQKEPLEGQACLMD